MSISIQKTFPKFSPNFKDFCLEVTREFYFNQSYRDFSMLHIIHYNYILSSYLIYRENVLNI